MDLKVLKEKKNLSLTTKTKPANRKYSQQHSPMAGAFHLVGHTNKTCRKNKARYFMPTHILRIKDREAPSFKLSLNQKRKTFRLFKTPT